jgi:hypothetical protein
MVGHRWSHPAWLKCVLESARSCSPDEQVPATRSPAVN